MLQNLDTAWLYCFSSTPGTHHKTYFTLFVDRAGSNGREILATISLSYLFTDRGGAGAMVKSYTPPFGTPFEHKDFAVNSLWAPDAIAVTYFLSVNGAEAYAQANLFYL
ncbi:hypothetical protein [Sphingomonas cavernae]|uniref:Uncharacterized protein n=1 Tax=Sphingomonas cavernae TaxID=2320861 RepID=A0A418WRQ8_9SPHN|nr:hypothetical protein [Sphingomonas cavernae]RJF93950.1 hypothetical protein D3876_06680 [Sphingomonas cavernae]